MWCTCVCVCVCPAPRGPSAPGCARVVVWCGVVCVVGGVSVVCWWCECGVRVCCVGGVCVCPSPRGPSAPWCARVVLWCVGVVVLWCGVVV